jgi:2-dehydro-3-deoxyphosphogluconate aldolase/(4S)-4-hydroxy-2-oxoglutarate aldolase
MKPLTIEKTVKKIGEQGLLPMFSQEKQSVAEQILEAAYAGGARALEFTNRTGRALEVFKYLRKRTRRDMPDLLLGAGTILDEEQAERFLEAGADFIVSPIVDKTVAKTCAKAKRMWCPGAASPTEMVQAQRMGAGLVKVFPARQLGGPDFIRAVLAPCPSLRLMATGGIAVDEKELRAWFGSGVSCVGVGSDLFPSMQIRDGLFGPITEKIRQTLEIIQEIRQSTH